MFSTDCSRISFWKAACGIDAPKGTAALSAQIKFFARCCLRRRPMRAWLGVFENAEFAPVFDAQPRLALKPTRVYISTAWNFSARCDALHSHYALMRSLVPPGVLKKIHDGGVDILYIVNTTTGSRVVLRMLSCRQFEREGELTLELADRVNDVPLARMSFCVCKDARDGARRIYIGGLQACADARVRPLVHDLAKEMHGMRAKAFVFWCVQQLAQRWSVTGIRGVDDRHHMSTKRTKRKKIAASYDEFWTECDGRHDANAGFWEMPVEPRQRGREELKPSRRKQHERRYAFLADVAESLRVAPGHFETAEFFHASPVKDAATPATPASPVPPATKPANTPGMEMTMAGPA
jgi:uncharacterized protein VirK/YbjX